MVAVDGLSVGAVQLAHRASQAVGGRGHEDEVHMVGHQAVGPNLHAPSSGDPGQSREVEAVVGLGEECPLTAVAALCDVVGHARHDDSGQSRRPVGKTRRALKSLR